MQLKFCKSLLACLSLAGALFAATTAPASADILSPTGANLHNYNSGRCIGISGGYAGDWTCTGNPDQLWHVGSANSAGWHQVINGNGECLAVSGGSTSQGALVRTWACNGGADQYWASSQYSGDLYYLVNYKSGLIVGVQGGSTANGARLVLWEAQAHADQLWY
ncbi:RICIN domain-containing protein [Streptomyces sp. 7R007]